MAAVNVHQAKTHFSSLLAEVAQGEEIVIAKAGQPVARLVPLAPPTERKRPLGRLSGQFTIPDDFDRWSQDEIQALFEGDR